MNEALTSHVFRARDYDLAATLSSGQAFRWVQRGSSWTGVIGQRWILLESVKNGISAQTIGPISDWTWASEYLRPDEDLDQVLRDFPEDEPMRRPQIPGYFLYYPSRTNLAPKLKALVDFLRSDQGQPGPTSSSSRRARGGAT